MKSVLFLAVLVTMVGCGKRVSPQGDNGIAGSNGYSILAISGTLSANIACPAGGVVTSLYQDVNFNGLVDVLTDKIQTVFTVCHGLQGEVGPTNAASVVKVIDLRTEVCDLSYKSFSEVILKLHDGRYLSSFSDNFHGTNTRFALLEKNTTYTTTDGNSCRFMINNNNELVKLN